MYLPNTDALVFDDHIDNSGVYINIRFDTFQVKNTKGCLETMKHLLKIRFLK